MKNLAIAAAAFIAGGVIASLGCMVLHDAAGKKVRSEITHPTGLILSSISQDIRQGRMDIAARKLQTLDRRYQDFLKGGKPPEVFTGEVLAIAATGTP